MQNFRKLSRDLASELLDLWLWNHAKGRKEIILSPESLNQFLKWFRGEYKYQSSKLLEFYLNFKITN